jgi:hypothetical protein
MGLIRNTSDLFYSVPLSQPRLLAFCWQVIPLQSRRVSASCLPRR